MAYSLPLVENPVTVYYSSKLSDVDLQTKVEYAEKNWKKVYHQQVTIYNMEREEVVGAYKIKTMSGLARTMSTSARIAFLKCMNANESIWENDSKLFRKMRKNEDYDRLIDPHNQCLPNCNQICDIHRSLNEYYQRNEQKAISYRDRFDHLFPHYEIEKHRNSTMTREMLIDEENTVLKIKATVDLNVAVAADGKTANPAIQVTLIGYRNEATPNSKPGQGVDLKPEANSATGDTGIEGALKNLKMESQQ